VSDNEEEEAEEEDKETKVRRQALIKRLRHLEFEVC
jgi:hypothetical protein